MIVRYGSLPRLLSLFLLLGGIGFTLHLPAVYAQSPTFRYFYDDLGRLRQVIDQQGNIRTYNYDAVGNILSIEAGAGNCAPAAPVVTSLQPDSCQAGTVCAITITGNSLLNAGVTTNNPQLVVNQCQTECTQITCRLAPSPFAALGPAEITVLNALGSAQASIHILQPPTVNGPGQTDTWHFAATKGQIITLTMTRLPNQANGSSSLDPQLELHDSRGFLLARDDDGGTSLPPGPGKNAAIKNFTLPATDTYLVVARGGNGTSGPYLLAIAPTTILLAPGPLTEPLPPTPQFTFSGGIAASTERDTHTFPANSGVRVDIEVNRVANNPDGTGTLDPAVELRDSRNFLLQVDNDGGTNQPDGPGRNALLKNVLLPATDTYRVVVSGSNGTTGPYEVKVFLHQ